jgi:hypothetical protein
MLAARWKRPPRGSQDMSSTVGFKHMGVVFAREALSYRFVILLSYRIVPNEKEKTQNTKYQKREADKQK